MKKLLVKSLIVLTASFLGYGSHPGYCDSSAISINLRQISDDTEVSTITIYQSALMGKATAQEYIALTYLSTMTYVSVDIYTNNVNASPDFIQRGGMINEGANYARVPMLWRVYGGVQPGGVAFTSTDNWGWLKDKADKDDPATSSSDESWNAAFLAGYSNVVTGNSSGAILGSFPLYGRVAKSPVYVYLAADFTGAASGQYSTTIWFDMYQNTPPVDSTPPLITHTPLKEIDMIGNKVRVEIAVTDNVRVDNAKLHYRKQGDTDYKVIPFVLRSDASLSYHGTVNILPSEMGKKGLEYYITAGDGLNQSSFGKNGYLGSVPQTIDPISVVLKQRVVGTISKNGKLLSLEDGNPDDGETSLDIPAGALSADTNITIEQMDPNLVPSGNGSADSVKPVAAYNFGPNGLKFRKPVTMTLLYLDLFNDGKVEMQDGTETNIDETKLGIFWWDGFDWRYAGGKVDVNSNVVSAKITHFTYYALFPVKPLNANDYRPKEKIITPARIDNKNDFATFDGLGDDFEIRIYDVTGRLVKLINQTSPSGPRWDGVDEAGIVVESGVYIYQFKANVGGQMKLISGTIAVAK